MSLRVKRGGGSIGESQAAADHLVVAEFVVSANLHVAHHEPFDDDVVDRAFPLRGVPGRPRDQLAPVGERVAAPAVHAAASSSPTTFQQQLFDFLIRFPRRVFRTSCAVLR